MSSILPASVFLRLWVLHLLSERERYGSELLREVRERLNSRFWKPGSATLFNLLRDLEDEKLAVSRWENPNTKSKRFYRITEQGGRALTEMRHQYEGAIREAAAMFDLTLRDLFSGR